MQNALKDQNRESAAGALGQAPATDIDVTMPIIAQGRLSSVGEFEDIVLRANPDGSFIRLRDVARVSLEASSYATESGINGGNAAVLNINMLPGACPSAPAADSRFWSLRAFCTSLTVSPRSASLSGSTHICMA